MSYTVIKHDNFVGVQSQDAVAVATGAAYMTPLPKTGHAICAPVRGRSNAVEFIIYGTPVLELDITDTSLQDSPTGSAVPFSGTRDQFIIEMNNAYLSSGSSSTGPTTPNMGSQTTIVQFSDFPAPVNNVVTLSAGTSWRLIGQVPQGGTQSEIQVPQDVVFVIEENVTIEGASLLPTALKSAGKSQGVANDPRPFFSLRGSTTFKDFSIDAGGSESPIIKTETSPTSNTHQHLWEAVNFQNGGLNASGPAYLAFEFGVIGNLVAKTCGVFNTGSIQVSTFPPATMFNSFVWERSNFVFSSSGSSHLFNIGAGVRIGRRIRLTNCVGRIDSPTGGLFNYNITDSNGTPESVIVEGCDFVMTNGEAFTSFGGVQVNSPQFVFSGNQIQGLPNTSVGVEAKAAFVQGQEPTTVLTQNVFSKINADVSGTLPPANVDVQVNDSRLWEVRVDSGISYFIYQGEQERRLQFNVYHTFSSGNNRQTNIRAQKGKLDQSGALDVASESVLPQSLGTRATSNGSGRPETIYTGFKDTFAKGDYLCFEVANFSNNANVLTDSLYVTTSEVA